TTLKLARRSAGTWTSQAVAAIGAGGGVGLAFDPAGMACIAHVVSTGAATDGVDLERWDGSRWVPHRIVDGRVADLDLVLASDGSFGVTVEQSCLGRIVHVFEQVPVVDVTVLRARVASIAPGWSAPYRPAFGSSNDEETGAFPLATTLPLSQLDCGTEGFPLALYAVDAPGAGLRVR